VQYILTTMPHMTFTYCCCCCCQTHLLSWLLPTLTPDKSCEGYEQLIRDTAATLHALIQTWVAGSSVRAGAGNTC
jgi:hypothetical protein